MGGGGDCRGEGEMSEIDVEAMLAMLDRLPQGNWSWERDFIDGTESLISDGSADLANHDRSGGAVLWAQDKNNYGAHLRLTPATAEFIAAAPTVMRAMLDEIVALRERVAELEQHAFVPPINKGQRVTAMDRIDAWLQLNKQPVITPGATGFIVRGWMAYKDDAPRYAYEVDFDGVIVTIMDRHVIAVAAPS